MLENGSTGFIFKPLPRDETTLVKDVFKNNLITYRTVGAGATLPTCEERIADDGYFHYVSILCNLLAYLNSGSPDIRDYRNEIRYKSPTSSKIVRADKDLSLENINLVGYTWKKDPLYQKESWYQKPHWARRYYGPGKTLERMVLISDCIKTRKALSETEKTG